MIENEEGDTEKRNSVNGEANATAPSQAERFPVNGSHRQDVANGSENGRQDRKGDPRRFLSRRAVGEWLTALIGLGSLAVSFLTYKNAADTSDLKNAVANLTTLASEARRQADAMRDQAKAMQGQLDQMTAAQRPWMLARDLTVEGVDVLPDDAIIMFSTGYKVTNFGQSPATDVFINTGLFIEGVDAIDVDAIRKLCKSRPLGSGLFLRFYRDMMGPKQTEEIIGFPIQNGIFVRDTRSLEESGISKVNANFVLGGCITYRFLGGDILHKTGFAIRAQSARVRIIDRIVELEQVQISKREKVAFRDLMLTSIPSLSFAD